MLLTLSYGQGRGAALASAVAGLLSAGLLMLAPVAAEAKAGQPITLSPNDSRIEITALGELYEARGDTLQVDTAGAADGGIGRMVVPAKTPGTNPNWLVFSLTNPTDRQVERWLTADRYNLIGSGAVWPDLDAKRIESVTPSIGFVPERVKSERADVFRVTLEPGQTITYVAELSSQRFPRVYLWKPLDYEIKVRERLLFNGALLGLTGLLAIFLTAIFAANHKLVFPSAALVAWCALAYLCVEFGFFHKLFHLKPEGNAVYRAAAEAALATSLVIFLHVFLRLALWGGLVRMLVSVWLLVQFSLIAVAVIDPRLAATFARLSFLVVGTVGAGLTFYLAVRGQDRALSLIPTWLLFLVWIFAAAVVLTGRLSGEMVVSSLIGGLVLILLIIGFTVTQYAFRSLEPVYGAAPSELQLRAIAVDGARASVWEWSNRRDEVYVGPEVEAALGLSLGELSLKSDEFSHYLHPADREKFKAILWSAQERADGRLHSDFRIRHADNSYRWFEIEASRIPGNDPRSVRCVGLIRDVTEQRRAHERLVHDAVHCNITKLPNKEILLDRLSVLSHRAQSETSIRPHLICVGIDKLRNANAAYGHNMGDSLILTFARRLQRHLGPDDTLARLGGAKFLMLLPAEQRPQDLAALAERIRRSLRSKIEIAGQEFVLTASIGIAVDNNDVADHAELVKNAEIAMYRARRGGGDKVEIFTPDMRVDRDERAQVEAELVKALERNQIRVEYVPIVSLSTKELAGFEAVARWEHPKFGSINPLAFEAQSDESDLPVRIGSYVLLKALRSAAHWQQLLPRTDDPLFVSIKVSEKELFRADLVQEIRTILGRGIVPKGGLRLEVPERLIMENPEQASEILEWFSGGGAEITLDEFGTGHTSLAHLQRLAFETIKVDRVLLSDCGAKDQAESTGLRSIIAFAHELGKKVIATGVESDEEVAYLRAMGCAQAEGPCLGGTHTEQQVAQLLKSIRKTERKLQPRGLFTANTKKKIARARANGDDTKKKRRAAAQGAGGHGAGATPPAPPQPAERSNVPVSAVPGSEDPKKGQEGKVVALPKKRPARRGSPPPWPGRRGDANGADEPPRPVAVSPPPPPSAIAPLAPNPLTAPSPPVIPIRPEAAGGPNEGVPVTAPPTVPPPVPPQASQMPESMAGAPLPVGDGPSGGGFEPPLPPVSVVVQDGPTPPPIPPTMSSGEVEDVFAESQAFEAEGLPRFLGSAPAHSRTPPESGGEAEEPSKYAHLPPAVAASLARLAGKPAGAASGGSRLKSKRS